jgi:hypothetical protein
MFFCSAGFSHVHFFLGKSHTPHFERAGLHPQLGLGLLQTLQLSLLANPSVFVVLWVPAKYPAAKQIIAKSTNAATV